MLKNIDDRPDDLLQTLHREGRPPSRPAAAPLPRAEGITTTALAVRRLQARRPWSRPGATLRCIGVKEEFMETILFFVVWLGGALLHTLFDLKIKPVLRAVREESDLP